jgi:TolB protein
MKFKGYISIFLIILVSVGSGISAQEIDSLDLEGKIAFIGEDFNVHTLDLATFNITQLTKDGTRQAKYEFPTWSYDRQLAYFCCGVRGVNAMDLSIYLSPDGISEGIQYYDQLGERHVYSYWSPVTCKSDDCVDLAVLIQDPSETQLKVELFNSHNKENGQRSLGNGTPFYYSWSPSGESLLLHRNNRLLQYYSISSAETVSAYDEPLGIFSSPSWSPTDNRILFASLSDTDISQITLLDNGTPKILADNLQGNVSFLWSPDGQFIAYRVANSNSISSMYVIDSDNGEVVARSNVSGILSFFWSPDSSKIAYITLANPPGNFEINNQTSGNTTALIQLEDGFAWNILNVTDSSNILLNSFIPTVSMQYLFANFDQFAQSHNLWSPDSQYIVYGERNSIDSRDSHITIIDVNDPNTEPFKVTDGSFAVWSYQ